jgi:hypothetical protein
MEQPPSHPYKLSVRRNKDLIRQYNQIPGRSQHQLQSSREISKEPFLILPGQHIPQYPIAH